MNFVESENSKQKSIANKNYPANHKLADNPTLPKSNIETKNQLNRNLKTKDEHNKDSLNEMVSGSLRLNTFLLR